MPVFRVKKVKDYTIMPNLHLRNRQLSLRAKGLLCHETHFCHFVLLERRKLDKSFENY